MWETARTRSKIGFFVCVSHKVPVSQESCSLNFIKVRLWFGSEDEVDV